jgi:ferredoxin
VGKGDQAADRRNSSGSIGVHPRSFGTKVPEDDAGAGWVDAARCALFWRLAPVIMHLMPAEPFRGIVGMVPDEFKHEPRSKGLLTARKKKPKELAVITECCTGCAGSPACVEYCPVEDCMFWVPDEDHPPFGRIQVDPILCIGCNKCTSKGPEGSFLDGCPWDAIVMIETTEVEKEVGVMPF